MSVIEAEYFEEIRQKGEGYYKSLQPLYCPYLKDKVHFTAEGLEHIKFKRRHTARLKQDQYMRFKLLKVIPVVLGDSKTVQGIWETKEFQRVHKHNRSETMLVPVTYYEFIAVVEEVRIKVIVKRTASGPYTFWSIIPFWGIQQSGTKRKLYSGHPKED